MVELSTAIPTIPERNGATRNYRLLAHEARASGHQGSPCSFPM